MEIFRWGVPVVVLGLVVVSAVAPGVSGAVYSPPAEESTPIDTCTTIAGSGHYVLTHDIESRTNTCVRVTADDVVVSGRGHSIDGGVFRENTTGIVVTGSNVTVRNLSVRQWTFGIRYESAPNGSVRNVTTWRTVDGVTFSSSPGANIGEVSATNGVSGLVFVDSDAVVLRDSTVRFQSSTGVLVADSKEVTVSDTSITRSETGIALLGSRQGRVTDSTVRKTGESALLLADSRGNTVSNTTVSNRSRPATVLFSNASENRLAETSGHWTPRSENGARKNSVVNATNDSLRYRWSA
ncbi:right-handed parallel beta-helix repeat-containing protein [Haladaptatus caseinilyticus]|uniref:right-handed parallel beta-helix repeat-containing protein n=1 Tax=Haladaptatus caseinilyticus TaxID=2993314 RepID=UPI00224A81CC|nr:right-handed parallel beta-helix repeat-containing protein [Haladaptatus caseinilyticus]